MELRRGYTHDGEGMLIELNRSSHYARIILKTGVPIPIAEHDIWSTVGTMLIGGVEDAAKVRLNAQYVEVVAAHFIEPDSGWIFAGVQPRLTAVTRCQAIEAVVAIAQIKIVEIGLVRRSFVSMLDYVEALRIRHMQRVQDQRVQHTKNHRVCADGHCQRHDGHNSKAWRFAQQTESEAQVANQVLDELQSSLGSIVLFHRLHSAELQHGLASCLNG